MPEQVAATSGVPNNLPLPLTSFVGRMREIAEVREILGAACLLTLVGAGGAGKTRLALEAAAGLLAEYPEGAWLVELAALADPSLVPQTVATVLGVREAPGRALAESLTDHLRPKTLLLVLDNCEHLVAACAQLAEALLHACPGLRVLATSREALGISGETSLPVPSLAVPDVRALPPLEALTQFEAVRLFRDRAAAVQRAFRVTDQNAAAVAQICRRLDGIPLAIELAAARLRVLPVEQIAARLDDRFRLLTGGSRTALERHQTLQAAIDWSYNLLNATERALLLRLSVFAGGWTLEAAEAVGAGGEIEARAVLDLLSSLVDKSLALAEAQGGQGRYRFLETIRQYAADRLLESGETAAVRDRHLGYFLRLAEEGETALQGAEDSQWLARLETEHDNLRAALGWSQKLDEVEMGLRLASALYAFWNWHAHPNEGRRWLESALSRTGSGVVRASRLRARALVAAGLLAGVLGDFTESAPALEEGLEIARRLGDKPIMANALMALGTVARSEGQFERAKALYVESQILHRDLGDKFGEAIVLHWRSLVARLGGDLEGAEAPMRESLALNREIPSKFGTARALMGLGVLAVLQGARERAATILKEALQLEVELGDKLLIAYILDCLGGVCGTTGQPEAAARLFGAAEVAPENFAAFMPPDIRAVNERARDAAAAALGETAFAAALAEGRAMPLERAVAYALALPVPAAGSAAASASAPGRSSHIYPAGLTEREVEVLRLVAQGLTSAQVAERLVISPVTVSTHLRNIYGKIGANTRAAAAKFAIEHGLA
jgi:non-specific serine/threonine protein kinase